MALSATYSFIAPNPSNNSVLYLSTTTVNMTCYFGSQSISKSAKVIVKYGGGGGGVDF